MRATIEAEVDRWYCKHNANVVQTERCTREELVGTCREGVLFEEVRPGIRDRVDSPIDTFYYAPVTAEQAELRCTNGEYSPASD